MKEKLSFGGNIWLKISSFIKIEIKKTLNRAILCFSQKKYPISLIKARHFLKKQLNLRKSAFFDKTKCAQLRKKREIALSNPFFVR